jgi:hypothetical protein
MNTPTKEDVIQVLNHLREMMLHRMKSPDISPVVYNECLAHVRKIDEQLRWHERPEVKAAPPARIFNRKERQAHKRKAGNTFTDRMNARRVK